MSVEQARSQMNDQVAAGPAEQDMPPELSEVYAGRQMFHDRGGLVVVAVTDPSLSELMRQHFMRFGVDHVEVRVTSLTDAQMEDLIGEIQDRLRRSRAEGAQPMVDVGLTSLGRVTVWVAEGDLNETEASVVDTARATPDLYEVIEVDEIAVSQEV